MSDSEMSVHRTKGEDHYACREVKQERDQLRARLAELEAEKAELVKDRERLDWLASQKYPEIRQRDLCWISCDSHAEYHGETLRQAIDAAREGE